ncbi:MAG: phosphoribosyltransferase family protein [candidate division WOR-3 bacterium]
MKNIKKILENNNVILKGHFLLTSGLHSDIYFEKFRLLENPNLVKKLIKTKEKELQNLNVTLCIGPLTGGALVAFAVGDILNIRSIYMEKEENEFVLKRDFKIYKEDKILLCDDVLTTGSSFLKIRKSLAPYLNQIVGHFVLIDRSTKAIEEISPVISVYKEPAVTYTAEECPLCKMGIPVEKRGSSKITP